jgi:hypothetical protein
VQESNQVPFKNKSKAVTFELASHTNITKTQLCHTIIEVWQCFVHLQVKFLKLINGKPSDLNKFDISIKDIIIKGYKEVHYSTKQRRVATMFLVLNNYSFAHHKLPSIVGHKPSSKYCVLVTVHDGNPMLC